MSFEVHGAVERTLDLFFGVFFSLFCVLFLCLCLPYNWHLCSLASTLIYIYILN